MTHVFNDPAAFAEESLEGFALLHGGLVRQVHGGVVSRLIQQDGKVAVVLGGGSGHYPMFDGLVGSGMADGAVVGNIFTSPSTHFAYSVAKHAHRGGGVVFCYGNYAGDVMNFGLAEERLRAEGIDAVSVIVRDDVLSASSAERDKRRGLAGDFTVMRALAGAAADGLPLAEVVAIGEEANRRTRTVGVGFAGCTFPGASHRLFEVPPGKMGIGLGAHGEPGLETIDAVPARELARILLQHIASDVPEGVGERVAVIVNGMGATKAEELFVLWRDLLPQFAARGWVPVEPEVGEIITSLDMAGLSLTVTWLDDALERYWTAPAYAPGYRKGRVEIAVAAPGGPSEASVETQEIPAGSADSQRAAVRAVELLDSALASIRDAEESLADADSVAGDGDHGRGMVRGLDAAAAAAHLAVDARAGLGTTIALAGDAWAEQAGGTSGVLWGAALRALGNVLADETAPDGARLAAAGQAFEDAVRRLGRVELGDKTMLDAIVPTVDVFAEAVAAGFEVEDALARAAGEATAAAGRTAQLSPKVGRARPLAERSIGHPDPGAVSFAIIVRSLRRPVGAGVEASAR